MKYKCVVVLLLCTVISNGHDKAAHATTREPEIPQNFLHPDPCEFKAKVTPEEKTEKVEAIYRETCEWFIHVFQAIPSPDIPLDDIKFVESWDSVPYVKNTDGLYGTFYANHIKEVNEIVILNVAVSEHWKVTPLWRDSELVHEIVHYLTKSSSWDTLSKVDRMNYAILEAHAYWSQDQYIRRKSNGTLTLNDFITDKGEATIVYNFEFSSIPLYNREKGKYLYNAIAWFGTDPQKKFAGIVTGKYVAHSLYFR